MPIATSVAASDAAASKTTQLHEEARKAVPGCRRGWQLRWWRSSAMAAVGTVATAILVAKVLIPAMMPDYIVVCCWRFLPGQAVSGNVGKFIVAGQAHALQGSARSERPSTTLATLTR